MTNEKLFNSGIELTSDAERLVDELKERQENPLRLILGEDTYAGMQDINLGSRTVYTDGEVDDETREYLQDRGFNVEDYDDIFEDTEVLVDNGVTVESPTEDAFISRLNEKISRDSSYDI